MSLLLQAVEVPPCLMQSGLRVFHARFDFRHARLRLLDAFLALLDQDAKLLDLALPFKQAVAGGIGRKEGHTLPADDVAARGHVARGRRQLLAVRQRKGQIGSGINFTQPVAKNRGEFWIIAANMLQQSFRPISRYHAFERQ